MGRACDSQTEQNEMRASLNRKRRWLVEAGLALAFGVGFAACSGDDEGISPLDGGLDAQTDTYLSEQAVSVEAAAESSAPASARDWSTYPPVVEMDGVSEIWALSDIHGDYSALTKLLAGAGVIASEPVGPSAVLWSAGTATLVVVGDAIDKGPDAPDVVRLLIALRVSAEAAGGHVIVTMGNHEAEFLADPENDKATKTGTDEGIDPELSAIGLAPDATAAGDNDIGVFIRNLPVACRIDDWFFAHAGKTDGFAIADIAALVRNEVDDAGFGAPVLADDASILEARLASTPPQWWDESGDAGALLTSWASAVGAHHLVMGHQPGDVGIAGGPNRNSDDMFAAYGGLLFLIDTGMSIGADHTGGALLHVKNAGDAGESWEEALPNGSTKSF
ncbi:MAG: metallophosphoesterase [Polyangiaceae bacterium]